MSVLQPSVTLNRINRRMDARIYYIIILISCSLCFWEREILFCSAFKRRTKTHSLSVCECMQYCSYSIYKLCSEPQLWPRLRGREREISVILFGSSLGWCRKTQCNCTSACDTIITQCTCYVIIPWTTACGFFQHERLLLRRNKEKTDQKQ